ncbi:MAG: helix-turn-helix domain-containing protein, partial [Pseudomonas aeruginosa]
PGRMQLDLRMERAANLLVESSFSITEISAQCGFSQPQHLATAFRKRYSLTPTEFRRHRLR